MTDRRRPCRCGKPKRLGQGQRYCDECADRVAEEQRLKASARTTRYRAQHPDRVREHARSYYERTAEAQKQRVREWARDNPERVQINRDRSKAKRLPRLGKYGLTLADYKAMLAEQDGRCPICGRTENGKRHNFDVDHDHATGVVRGLLCNRCNRLLSNALDDPEILERAIAYLRKAKACPSTR